MRMSLSLAWLLIGAVAAHAADDVGPTRNAFVATHDPLGEPVAKVVYLEQNWSPAQSNWFYFTPQGSQVLPYDWFLALEQVDSQTPFREIQNVLKYRYLAQNPGPMNPDGLPVGFVADRGIGRTWLGMTCAACHTTEIRLGDTAYRIDGAPTHGDVQGLLTSLVGALKRTRNDSAKFTRFAALVLKDGNTPQNQVELKGDLDKVIKMRDDYNLRNFLPDDPRMPPPADPLRYGRLDAVDAIVNEIYYHALAAADAVQPTANTKPADAPVSYPCLWDTPQHDFVEWLGIAKSGGPLDVLALSRNVGEVLGVFGDFNVPDHPGLPNVGYPSSVKIVNLRDLETLLKSLWSPKWPDDFPTIDQDAAAKGAELYKTNCVSCHALIDRKDRARTVTAMMKACGTDGRAAENFFLRTGSSGKLNGVNVNFVPFTRKVPPVADADTMITNVVLGTILGDWKDAPLDPLSRTNFRGPHLAGMLPAAVAPGPKYKARPLNGIWATAPYLHNGSVPTLEALLSPVKDRPASFSIGVRTFDPKRVGYLTDVPGFPKFSVNNPDGTPITGNSNAGHLFGVGLSAVERQQLLEYLKTL